MTRKEHFCFCLIFLIIFSTVTESRSRRLLQAGSEITEDEMYTTREKKDRTKKHKSDADPRLKSSENPNEGDSDKSIDETAKSRSEWMPSEQSSVSHPEQRRGRRKWQGGISDKWSDVRSEETIGSKKVGQSDAANTLSIYRDQSSIDRFDSSVSQSSEGSLSGTKVSSKSASNSSSTSISSEDSDKSRLLEHQQPNSSIDISNKTPEDRTDHFSNKKATIEDNSQSASPKEKSLIKRQKEHNKHEHRRNDYLKSGTRDEDVSLAAADRSLSQTKSETHGKTSDRNNERSQTLSKHSNMSERNTVSIKTGSISEPAAGVTSVTRMAYLHETSDDSTVLKTTTPYTQSYSGTSTLPSNKPITESTHTGESGTIYSKYTRNTFGTEIEVVTKAATTPISEMSSNGISTVSNVHDSQNNQIKEITPTNILTKSLTSSGRKLESNFVINTSTAMTPSIIIKPPFKGVPKCKRRTPPCCVSGELSLNLGTFRRKAYVNGDLEGVLAHLSAKPQKRFISCSNSAEIKISFEPMGNEGCFGCTSGPFCGRRMLQLDLDLSQSKRRNLLFGISEASARNGDSIVYAKYPNIKINPRTSDNNGTGGIEIRGAVNAYTNKLTLFIGNEFVRVTSDRSLDESFCHNDLFHLNGQFDAKSGGMSLNTITVWINKAPSSTEEYMGFGVCEATLKWACPWAEY